MRTALALVLAAAVLASCETSRETAPAPAPTSRPATSTTTTTVRTTRPAATTTATTTTTTTSPAPTWELGATPLPTTPDGLGQVLPTPAALVDRRLPTRDLLPPPPDDRFHSSIGPVDAAVLARMGGAWHPACPVGLEDLRYLTVTFRGFDGDVHTGELVVHHSVAADVVRVFERLFAASFPIEEMRLVTGADLEAPPTGDGNNTAAFACRPAVGSTTWSAHASGLAIDLNPFQNPYRRGAVVIPELASAYLDRDHQRPGMIHPGDVVTEAFAAIGWTWGGTFRSSTDLHHFSANGR